MTRPSHGRHAFSCVVDNQRRFHRQAALWVSCLLRYQRISPERVFVHLVTPADGAFSTWLEGQGVRVAHVPPFDVRSGHCNKLGQLTTQFGAEQVVLMDCDTVWLGGTPLPAASSVAAKIVDKANPASHILSRIFAAAGFSGPGWTDINFPEPGANSLTDRNNCNGGVYIVAAHALPALADAWPRWARWCLAEQHLFGRHINFDQVSYALAARDLGIRTDLLGVQWNYPTHYPDWPLPDVGPEIVHYHKRLSPRLELLPIGVTQPDKAMARFNLAMNASVEASDALAGFRSE